MKASPNVLLISSLLLVKGDWESKREQTFVHGSPAAGGASGMF